MFTAKYSASKQKAKPLAQSQGSSSSSLLETMPLEIFIKIAQNMPLTEIIELGEVSKRMRAKLESDEIWEMLLIRDFKVEPKANLGNKPLSPKQYYQLLYLESKNVIDDFCKIPENIPGFYYTFSDFPIIKTLIDKLIEWKAMPPCDRFAILREYKKIHRQLLSKLTAPNTRTPTGQTPISEFAASGQINLVKALIQQGADVNSQENNHMTTLHMAALHGHGEIGKLLIKHGAKAAAKFEGKTAAEIAEQNSHHPEAVELFKNNDPPPRRNASASARVK